MTTEPVICSPLKGCILYVTRSYPHVLATIHTVRIGNWIYCSHTTSYRLCGLVVRVPDYRARGPGFDFCRYEIFGVVVGLERGPLCLMSSIEVLLGRKSCGSGLGSLEYGRVDPLL
jgi:hypothetical protein